MPTRKVVIMTSIVATPPLSNVVWSATLADAAITVVVEYRRSLVVRYSMKICLMRVQNL
jgi:hypothetical protein